MEEDYFKRLKDHAQSSKGEFPVLYVATGVAIALLAAEIFLINQVALRQPPHAPAPPKNSVQQVNL